jgi:uncharacterized protein YkwD
MRALAFFIAAAFMAAAPLQAAVESSSDYPVGAALARQWTAAENRSSVLAALNTERQRHGLGPLRMQAQLQQAAQAHADYLALHRRVSHLQEPGTAGFSGQRPLARAQAAGYAGKGNEVAELFVIGLTDAQAALDQLLSGPYHRHFLLWAAASEVGIGLSAQPGLVIAMGSAAPASGGADWVLWPPPGARDVPPAACCERPRPAGLDEFGTPVSVQARPGERLAVHHFHLRDADGRVVSTQLLHAATDEHLRSVPHIAYLLPLQPLQAGQRYGVELDVEAGGRRLQRQWSFETAP